MRSRALQRVLLDICFAGALRCYSWNRSHTPKLNREEKFSRTLQRCVFFITHHDIHATEFAQRSQICSREEDLVCREIRCQITWSGPGRRTPVRPKVRSIHGLAEHRARRKPEQRELGQKRSAPPSSNHSSGIAVSSRVKPATIPRLLDASTRAPHRLRRCLRAPRPKLRAGAESTLAARSSRAEPSRGYVHRRGLAHRA
jgi:hypothetical protein